MNATTAANVLEHVVTSSVRLRPISKHNYLQAIRRFLQFAGSDPARWNGQIVEQWRDVLAATAPATRPQEALTPRTVNTYLAAVKYASKRFAALGYGPDFAAGAEQLSETREKTRAPLPLPVAEALLRGCATPAPVNLRDRAIIVLGLKTGLRVGGMSTLQFTDLRPPRLTVTLKGGHRHTFVADPEVFVALDAWCDWLHVYAGVHTGHVFRGLRPPGLDGRIQVYPGMSTRAIEEMLTKRSGGGGFHVHPHLFRHTFISWARAAGVPDWRIAQVTGHEPSKDGEVPMLQTYTTDTQAPADPVGAYLPPLLGR